VWDPDGDEGLGGDLVSSERLLERDQALRELRDQFDDTNRLPPAPIVIEGRTGVGKTALLRSVHGYAADRGWHVLWASGSDVEAKSPFGVVRQLFASLRGPDASPSADREVEALLSDLVTGAASPLSTAAVFDRLDGHLNQLQGSTGVLVSVDDANWSDPQSGEWLYYLARRLEHRRTRLIITMPSRSTGLPVGTIERIVSTPSTRVISVGPLGYESVTQLVGAHFAERPHEQFVRACHRATGGNPRLLFALLNEFPPIEFRPTLQSVERIATIAPAAVARSVLVRLANLPPHAHDFLDAVAVLGDQADLVVAAQLAGIDVSTASAIVDQLAAVDLLHRERPIRFLHPLVRTTIYHDVEPARRTALHVGAAKCLSARDAPVQALAPHLLAAEPIGDEWAARQMQQCGHLALRQGAPELALRCLSRALAETPTARENPELLLDLARAEAALGLPTAFSHLRAAAEQGMDALQLARVALMLVRGFQDSPDTQEALRILAQVVPRLPPDQIELIVELEVVAGLLSRSSSALMAAAEAVTSSMGQLPGSGGRVERMACALLATAGSTIGSRASAEQVVDLARRAVASQELVNGDPLAFRLWARALTALAQAGHCAEADRYARSARASALELGLDLAVAEFSTALATSLIIQGSLSDAETEARRALLATEGRPWIGRPLAIAALSEALSGQGQFEESEALLATCDEADVVPWTLEGRALLEQRGRLRALQSRPAEALADLLLAGHHADEGRIDNPAVTCWRAGAVLAFRAQRRTDEAVGHSLHNLRCAREAGAPWAIGAALRTAALVAPLADRPVLLREAIELLADTPARLERAAALVDLGSALHHLGESTEAARECLRQGADLALQCGAAPLVSAAETELRQTGARPRRIALTGADALTSGEQRVVTLAVSGHTNAEIARALFVSEKTVEGHLRRAYRKLGIRSRRDLPSAASAVADPDPADGPHGSTGRVGDLIAE
jgi:DNA-binding CsgD family transcriptional regulator